MIISYLTIIPKYSAFYCELFNKRKNRIRYEMDRTRFRPFRQNRIRTVSRPHFVFSQCLLVKIVDIFEGFRHSCHLTIYLQNVILQFIGGKTLYYVDPGGFYRSVRIRLGPPDPDTKS